MKFKILIFSLIVATLSSYAQGDNKTEKAAVKATINQLFDGMREGDSAKVHGAFHKEVRMYTTLTDKTGKEILHQGSLEGFLNAVGTPHPQIWDEKLTRIEIQVDDRLAQVWTDYQFYLGDTFSHCGVNAFQLVKSNGKWQIIHLIDTRRKKDCLE